MRKFFLCTLIILSTLGLSIQDATAGRFGGGGFRSMRSNTMYSRGFNSQRTAQPHVLNRTPHGKMRGLFSGMLVGGLLASLFMGHGLGSALISWFFLGMIVLLVIGLLQRKAPDTQFRKPRDYDH